KLLISSRLPFFGAGSDPASPLADVIVADTDIPALVRDLPSEPIALPADLPPVAPLQVLDEGEEAPTVVLRRGPQSENASAPILILMTDAGAPDAAGARLMVLGMSITWLPEDVGAQLVNNMADYMVGEE
ncbi:MAG: hypothetical protein M3Q45_10720, partial [Chloroflexota bacterium]|nr:hypothetical protein [Chloroflexota bacterium]